MKLFFIYISLINSFLFSQTIDTSYSENFKIISERHDKFPIYYNGFFKKFDSKGILVEEGNYQFRTKIPCVTCFDYEIKIDSFEFSDTINGKLATAMEYRQKPTDKLVKIESIDSLPIKTGIWKTYHSNGKISSSGLYSDKVHIHFTSDHETSSTVAGWYGSFSDKITTIRHTDYLKTGTWEYFNEEGKLIRIEEYLDGQLLYQKNEIENKKIQKECESKTIDIKLGSSLEFLECVDNNLDIWENLIESKIIFESDTLDVIKIYELHFKFRAENLNFIDFKANGNHYTATYFYSGCVGEFCREDLKLEFEFDKNGKLHVTDLYDFDEETQSKIDVK